MDQNEISLATYDCTERMTFANLNSLEPLTRQRVCQLKFKQLLTRQNPCQLKLTCAVAPDKGFANLNLKDSVRVKKKNFKKSIK